MNDPDYLTFIRRQECCAPGCERVTSDLNPIVAHHHSRGVSARRGKGRKAPDRETMPLHHLCHIDFHGATGFAKRWDKARRIEWQDAQVELHQSIYFSGALDAAELSW